MKPEERLAHALSDRYRVSRELGAGGMATVYLAHDLRHDRDVAIKVLHPDLAAALGAERFLAEIKTTARLHHPHILPLLDSGEADGLLFYVMPYVAGESLRARLDRETQLPVEDAVRIAREVASALESAHKQGVVHRDIKPENILLHEEQALVADFGIALAVSAAGGPRMTQTGLSLGTPAYMAPEQAMGERVIDGRADIYALGAVLYEMLVGEAPFTGPTVQAIVARVMTEQPRPVTGQRKSVPPHVNAAVLRALDKLPADRFHSAAEFAAALAMPGFNAAAAPEPAVALFRMPAVLRRPHVAWSVAGAFAIAAMGLLLQIVLSGEERAPVHLAVNLEPGMELNPTETQIVELSPDGSMMAVSVVAQGISRLALRSLRSDSIRYVRGSEGLRGNAAFSPDGRWLAFNVEDRLIKAPVSGGPPTNLASARWGQVTWAGPNTLVYTYNYDTGLRRVSAEGRDSAIITEPDRQRGELGHWWPQTLPDGDHVLFTSYTTPADRSRLEVLSLSSGERKVILEGGWFGRYAAGQLLFMRGGALHRVPFDPRRLRLNGSPTATGVDVVSNPTNGSAAFSLAENGTLAFAGGGSALVELVWLDASGNEELAVDSAANITAAVASPDNRRIALVKDGDVWTYERSRRLLTRLTRSEQREGLLVWTPDSRDVLYQRDEPQFDIFRRSADGSGAEMRVLTSPRDKNPTSVSPDGRLLLFSEAGSEGDDVWIVPLAPGEEQKPELLLGGTMSQDAAMFSPNGRWVAYASNESGRSEVYVVPFPLDRGPSRQQISPGGGGGPEWSADGSRLYYGWAGRLFRVAVNPVTGEPGTPEPLPRVERMRGWSIGPDGRVLVARAPAGAASQSVKVILNWTSTIKSPGNAK